MGKPELGAKCTCTGCHERFYDLNRTPAICPKCGAEQPPEKPRALRPPRSTFGLASQSRQRPAAVAIDHEAEPAEAPDADADDDADADVADADDDDDIEIDPDLAKTAD